MRAIILLSALLLFGCDQQKMLQSFSTPADQAQAKVYLADLQSGRLDTIESALDPSIKTPAVHDALAGMARLLPAGPPTSVKLVGAQKTIMPSGSQTNTTFEYQWGNKWFLCNVAVKKSATAQTIIGINVYPEKSSLDDTVRFTLTNKSLPQYGILAGAILAFIVSLVALVLCIRTKGIPRKWLWILFIIVGFGQLSTNWATGAVNAHIVFISLFSAGAFAPFYGPWTISMSAPVGAVTFLLRRRRRRMS